MLRRSAAYRGMGSKLTFAASVVKVRCGPIADINITTTSGNLVRIAVS